MKSAKAVTRGSTKKGSAPKDIDEYLAGVPEPARTTLSKIRATIRAAAPPDATETISYRMPAFRYNGMLVWFAAFSDHCSLFPTAAVVEAFKDELKGYTVSKGTIHFPIDKPLPATLVKKMVKARVALLKAGSEAHMRKGAPAKGRKGERVSKAHDGRARNSARP